MTDPLIGTQLDEYRLESLLGQGGMARVYRGLDTGLQRYAAVKVIDTPHRQDEAYITRFEREARAIAALDHPHIVSVYRYGQAHNLLYLAMKYIEGADLHTILSRYEQDGQLMPVTEMTRLLREMGSALDYAHSHGVVHRDIKPSNVMLDAQGRSYITDFGLALLADVGTRGEILGSPHYVAPEQAVSSAGAVPQSDLYALGVILYRMTTGQLPFVHDDLLELLMLHMTAVPPAPRTIRPDLTPSVEAVILKALAKEPGDRFQSGKALADAVEAALKKTILIPPTTAVPTIIDRVALDMETLPPPPAAVTPPLTVPQPTASMPPTIQGTAVLPAASGSSLPLKAVGGGVMLLLLVLAAVFLFRGRAGPGGPGANVGADVTPAATAATTDPVNVSLPGETATAVATTATAAAATATAAIVETATTLLPSATDTPLSSGAMSPGKTFLPVIAREGGQPTPATPTPPSAETATPPSTAAAVSTQTPAATLSAYTLVFETKEDTLFMTNASAGPFLLAGLELVTGRNGRQRFSAWGQPMLPAGACLHMSKKAKDATDNINHTACSQLVGGVLEYDWKEEFTLWYNGREAQQCDLDDERRCVISLQP